MAVPCLPACLPFCLSACLPPQVSPVHARYLAKQIQHAQLLVFPDGKHNLHLKHADTFNSVVGAFLTADRNDDALPAAAEVR
jgi:hypothetical protein